MNPLPALERAADVCSRVAEGRQPDRRDALEALCDLRELIESVRRTSGSVDRRETNGRMK